MREANADRDEGHATFPDSASGAVACVRPDTDTARRDGAETAFFQRFSQSTCVGTPLAMHGLRPLPGRDNGTQETTMTIRLFRPAHAHRALDGLRVFSICAAGVATGLMLGLTRLIAG